MAYGEAEVKDRVEFRMNGVRFTGTVESVNEKTKTAKVVFSRGVDVLMHVEDLTVTKKALLTEDEQMQDALRYMEGDIEWS